MLRTPATLALTAVLCTGALVGCGEKSDDDETKAGAAAQSTADFCEGFAEFNEASEFEAAQDAVAGWGELPDDLSDESREAGETLVTMFGDAADEAEAQTAFQGLSTEDTTALQVFLADATELCADATATDAATEGSDEALEECDPRSDAAAADPASTHATIHTSAGDIKVELFPSRAPETVANFVGLADGSKEWDGQDGGTPLYDCTIFHRVIAGFMIQGGDPDGTGMGGPGYSFEDEVHEDDSFAKPYLLAMANSGPDTNGSQFFITVAPTTHLNGLHTIFGRVTDPASRKVVDKIATVQTDENDKPLDTLVIESITFD